MEFLEWYGATRISVSFDIDGQLKSLDNPAGCLIPLAVEFGGVGADCGPVHFGDQGVGGVAVVGGRGLAVQVESWVWRATGMSHQRLVMPLRTLTGPVSINSWLGRPRGRICFDRGLGPVSALW